MSKPPLTSRCPRSIPARRIRGFGAALCLIFVACGYAPQVPPGVITCSPGGSPCPAGYLCVARAGAVPWVCDLPDAASGEDAPPGAPEVSGAPAPLDTAASALDTPVDDRCDAGACGDSGTCVGEICGADCVDLASDPNHCGGCRRACPGTCSAGACACVTPNPKNLLHNGGFDRDTSGWQAEPELGLTTSEGDAANCLGSRVALITLARPRENFQHDVSQCITIAVGQRYNFGAWVRCSVDSPTSRFEVWIDWMPHPGCQSRGGDPTPAAENASLPTRDAGNTWRLVKGQGVAPPGVVSARVNLRLAADATSAVPIRCNVDMAHVTPAPGAW